MPFYHRPRFDDSPFRATLQSFVQGSDLPLRDVLSEDLISRMAAQEQMSFEIDAVYSCAVVLWAFLTQVSSKDQTCRCAVGRIISFLLALGRTPCSARTGAYCKARKKLSDHFLRRLTIHVGEGVEQEAHPDWRWHNRRALLVDGTTVTAPDTPANQRVYPQNPSQEPGLGFPIIRLVVVLTLATATLVGAAMGPYCGKETGETALFRTLLQDLQPGDVLVADRFYCSYWMVALALTAGADVVFRMHHRRDYDFRRGWHLGAGDHIVPWMKPQRPDWMDQEIYELLPETLTIREIRKFITSPGCRARELVIATTMTDADRYNKEDLLDLYHDRWHVELDIGAIKQSLQMDVLRCKSPEMLHKEIWAHLLVYNLARKVMAQAALQRGINPRTISFMGTLQMLQEFRVLLAHANEAELARLGSALLEAIAAHRVGNRPDRCEPRAVKRRPKEYDRLTKPRAEARALILNG
jgi:hypothetical protein